MQEFITSVEMVQMDAASHDGSMQSDAPCSGVLIGWAASAAPVSPREVHNCESTNVDAPQVWTNLELRHCASNGVYTLDCDAV